MLIRNISIRNFRGIRELDWAIKTKVVGLIGPGDSTKTTILDAIDYCFHPYYNLIIDDSDFYSCAPQNTIEIEITVTNIHPDLLADHKYGLMIRGWNNNTGINDEPKNGDEIGITVKLIIDDTLEPKWAAINNRSPDKPISHRDRAKLCINRLASYVDRNLSWARGSTIYKITDDIDPASSAITKATRDMRDNTDIEAIEEFKAATDKVEKAANKFGVKPKDKYSPKLDPKALLTGTSAISIHDGPVPLRAAGLGSKRLVTLALQLDCSKNGSIVLVDEIEEGLEPYRLRHVLREFNKIAKNTDKTSGQVFLTTHSPITTVELPVLYLYTIRSEDGKTVCLSIPSELQGTIRAVPEAILAPRVLVCEGKTEYGIYLELEEEWGKTADSYGGMGVAVVEGGGDDAPKRALELAELGYDACLFIDSDCLTSINPNPKQLKDKGVRVIHWADKVATEQRVSNDLPIHSLQAILDLAIEEYDKTSVRANLINAIPELPESGDLSISQWISGGIDETTIREAIGIKAKNKSWFKRIDRGKKLGKIILQALPKIPDSDLNKKITEIKNWVYNGDTGTASR